jgi:hypothetical protein
MAQYQQNKLVFLTIHKYKLMVLQGNYSWHPHLQQEIWICIANWFTWSTWLLQSNTQELSFVGTANWYTWSTCVLQINMWWHHLHPHLQQELQFACVANWFTSSTCILQSNTWWHPLHSPLQQELQFTCIANWVTDAHAFCKAIHHGILWIITYSSRSYSLLVLQTHSHDSDAFCKWWHLLHPHLQQQEQQFACVSNW